MDKISITFVDFGTRHQRTALEEIHQELLVLIATQELQAVTDVDALAETLCTSSRQQAFAPDDLLVSFVWSTIQLVQELAPVRSTVRLEALLDDRKDFYLETLDLG